MNQTSIPAGFEPAKRVGPFLDLFGPIYVKRDGERRIVATRVVEKHLNTRGIVHGGMLVTLADSALGINLAYFGDPPRPMVTVSLTTDFVYAANLGDWIEAHADIQKIGARLAFANCYLQVGDKRILRASGVFAIVAASTSIPGEERFDG